MTNYCDKISNLKIIKICSNTGQKEITVIQSDHESLINTKHDIPPTQKPWTIPEANDNKSFIFQ